jgi:putative endonuclease
MKHYVYILLCSDNSLYTGYTTDWEKRVKVHNKGKGSRYTRGRLPVKIVGCWEFEDKSIAMQAEYEIKQWSRQYKLDLVDFYNKHPDAPSLNRMLTLI